MEKAIVKKYLDKFTKEIGARYFLNDNDLSQKFEGEELKAATVYCIELSKEMDDYGVICGRVIHNARVRTFRKLTAPVVKDIKNPCSRCGGTGLMPFKHVQGGTCFKCGGTGSNKK